jgi:hypothetical protein
MRVDEVFATHVVISIQLLFSFDRGMRVEKTLMQTLASQLSSTLMQLLFSFEKILMQTLASQLSRNSCSRLTGTCELRKLSCTLSLLNSRATLVLVWPGHVSWENSRFSTLNSHATLVLVWENSHANSRFSTLMQLLFSFDRDMWVEKTLMHTLASQLLSTLMQLLFSFDRGMRVEKTLMQTLTSQLSSTLMQLLFSFDRGMRVEKTLMQTLASQLSCNSCSRLTGTDDDDDKIYLEITR